MHPYDIFSRKLEIINSPGGPNLCARLVPPSDTVYTDRNLPVKGIVSDRNIARYTLDLIDSSNSVTPLESVTEKNINGNLHLLDISLLTPGQPYTVMLKATDKAGNTATDSFTVIRVESESFITAYSTGNRYCSLSNPPEITFNLPDTADITLQITTTDFLPAKEILLGNFSAGSHTAVIDITNLPDGTYYFKLNATNSVTTFDSSIIVTIDNIQPAISLGSLPAFFNARAASSIAITATAEDSNLSLIELSIVDDNQNPVTTILSATNSAELKNAGFNPQLLPEAEYSLQLAVRDLAGNSSTASQLFTVDRTPPLFQHISPDFNAPLSGLVEIAAVITDTGAIQNSQVSLLYSDNSAEVLHAAAGNYLSFIWDTNQPFPDEAGEVALLFMATDLAGNTLTESKPVVMDNHAPGIEISFKTALVTNNTNFLPMPLMKYILPQSRGTPIPIFKILITQ